MGDVITNDQFDEPLYRIQNRKMKKKLYLALIATAQLGDTVDGMFWTPLRNVQVFAKKTFGKSFGPDNPLISLSVAGASFVASIPYLAKIFNENEINRLDDVLVNLENECRTQYFNYDQKKKALIDDEKTKLEDFLNEDLINRETNYNLKVKIVQKSKRLAKNFFRKKEYSDVKYELSDTSARLLSTKPCSTGNKKYNECTFLEVVEELFSDSVTHEATIPSTESAKLEHARAMELYYKGELDPTDAAFPAVVATLAKEIKNNQASQQDEAIKEKIILDYAKNYFSFSTCGRLIEIAQTRNFQQYYQR